MIDFMEKFLEYFLNNYPALVAGGLGGLFTTWLTGRLLNRRATFSYFVNHNMIGLSATDAVFGTVAVLWNGSPMQNLYLSTIEMKNESPNDYENIVIRSYTNDTQLMTEQTQLLDSPHVIEWSAKYKTDMAVNGIQLTDLQRKIYSGGREYVIPVLNRGQSVRLMYLNSANSANPPNIFLSVLQKGVKLKFRPPKRQVFGVYYSQASFLGLFIGIFVLSGLIFYVSNPFIIALGAFVYGLFALLPGAYLIKMYLKIKELIDG
jgi:hypothetical protein